MNHLGGSGLHRIAVEAVLAQGESRPEECKIAQASSSSLVGDKVTFQLSARAPHGVVCFCQKHHPCTPAWILTLFLPWCCLSFWLSSVGSFVGHGREKVRGSGSDGGMVGRSSAGRSRRVRTNDLGVWVRFWVRAGAIPVVVSTWPWSKQTSGCCVFFPDRQETRTGVDGKVELCTSCSNRRAVRRHVAHRALQ